MEDDDKDREVIGRGPKIAGDVDSTDGFFHISLDSLLMGRVLTFNPLPYSCMALW